MFYLFYWYLAIREAYRRDHNIALYTLLSFLITPFATYAYLIKTKSDSDRITVSRRISDGSTEQTTLSNIILGQTTISEIEHIENIGLHCRFCNTPIDENATRCHNCHKQHLRYSLAVMKPDSATLKVIPLNQWQSLSGETIITEVLRERIK